MLDDGLVVDIVFQGRERSVPELVGRADRRGRRPPAPALRPRAGDPGEPPDHRGGRHPPGTGRRGRAPGAEDERGTEGPPDQHRHAAATGLAPRPQRPRRTAPPPATACCASPPTPGRRPTAPRSASSSRPRSTAPAPTTRSGTWLEHLTAALDYRSWHEFGIERHQHGKWQSATGPASGGERVLSVSLPLFAAASSHYASAGNPHAPRLVTLDEAFAGVDDDSRAKSLGLLTAFDLDVVMTSEREWGCYPQVPGLADRPAVPGRRSRRRSGHPLGVGRAAPHHGW